MHSQVITAQQSPEASHTISIKRVLTWGLNNITIARLLKRSSRTCVSSRKAFEALQRDWQCLRSFFSLSLSLSLSSFCFLSSQHVGDTVVNRVGKKCFDDRDHEMDRADQVYHEYVNKRERENEEFCRLLEVMSNKHAEGMMRI